MNAVEETQAHITQVSRVIYHMIEHLIIRAAGHDSSKLASPEVEVFEEYTPKLRGLTYGSPEYTNCLKEMQVAISHHYATNRHHPEHHAAGIRGMNLVDIVELFSDWKAATLRHADGDIYKSIEINQRRFQYSDDLKQIFINTANLLRQYDPDKKA